MNHPEISIIVPAFNEAERIESTLRDYAGFLERSSESYEIVVVDDGSRDATVQVVGAIARDFPRIRCIATGKNRGKGHAVRIGMLKSHGSIRVMVDADGSMDASQLASLLAPLRRGQCEIAIGSRYLKESTSGHRQPWWRRRWSRVANFFVRNSLVAGIRDTQCGFKAFRSSAALSTFGLATVDRWAFDLEVLALAQKQGLRILECPIHWNDDERSRISASSDLFVVIGEWWRIKRRMSHIEPALSLSR